MYYFRSVELLQYQMFQLYFFKFGKNKKKGTKLYKSIFLKFWLLMALIFCIVFSSNALPAKFYSVNSLFGISMRVTNSICKDDNGFVWASSKTGILRLTDDDYRIYQLPFETTGAIIVNLIYAHSKIIAYTNNGQIFSYNPVFDRFDLIINLHNTITDEHFDFYSLLINKSGDFWIALNSGLYKYHGEELSLIDKITTERYLISWLDETTLVIAKSEGISTLDVQTLKSEIIYKNSDTNPFLVSSLFHDKIQNKLWIGTFSNGLFSFDFSSASLSHILPSTFPKQPILDIEENSDSTLLIGIDGQGIWELNKLNKHLLNVYKESWSYSSNRLMLVFNSDNCTISGGVSFYELAVPLVKQIVHRANDANSLVNNNINSIIEDRDGKFWFATDNGISCWDVKTDQWKNLYLNNLEQAQVFLTLCEDDRGRIWAGSYSSGFYVLDGKTGREIAHYSRDNAEFSSVSNFIMDIAKDSQGDLWIGGINGEFICYYSKHDKFISYTNEPVSSFAELSPNQILLGFSYGISLLSKQTGEIQNFLPGFVVQDMLVEGDVVWVCTSGEGLLRFDYKRDELTKFTTQQGLPSNFINSIALADNYLWLGTESGLCRFDPDDKTAFTFSSIFPLSGISYNKSALTTLSNGHLAWGTNNGAVIFDPLSIREIPSEEGKIYFQDIAISGRSIREIPSFKLNTPVDSLQTINLKYAQNSFSLELISIGMQKGAKFSWMLEGFDKEWSIPSENKIITYTNIPSGELTLKVRLSDSSMSNVISERSIAFKIIPPFWRKMWFWVLIFVVLSAIIFLYLLYYINSLKQEHTEEKIRFFTNTAHDIRTSLTLIKAPVEELSKETNLTEAGKYYLKLAIEQARQLTSAATQLMDFQKVDIGKEQLTLSTIDLVEFIENRKTMFDSFAKSKNIELVFVAECESFKTAVDELKMEKIVDNLISNAIKYSHNDSQINISLKCDDKKWTLQVKDNGIGISKKAQRQLFKEFYRGDNAINSKVVGSGIGLLLVKNYVTMHGGNVSFTSQENVGSTFRIIFPLKTVVIKTEPTKSISELPKTAPFVTDITEVADFENETSASHKMKVLIVEDNDDLLNFMFRALSSEFKIITAVDGLQGWELISKQMPDLVVSDIMMPNMDGFELCKIMKSTYETSHIPIILLTALSEKTNQLHGLGLGADDYLTKPFDMNLLVQRIKSIIHNREVVREKALKLINKDTSEPLFANDLNDKFVKKMLEVARANISNSEFDKDQFASAMNVSSSLLYKKIKSLTDQSPTDFIKTVRLNHAVELLQSRKYTVTEVSENCGFASVGYFSTVFKKHFGKSPSEV